MRISSSMIYNQGTQSIQDLQSQLLNTQQQLAADTSILTPADNPVAAAQVVIVTQAQAMNTQYASNQTSATSALNLQSSQLDSVTSLLSSVQSLAIEAGNPGLQASDKASIATQLSSDFSQLMSLANSTDANGNYIFAGYNGNTQPFAGSLSAMVANPATDVSYQGSSGQQNLQVAPSRSMAISDPGNSIFMNVPAGNGTFRTSYTAANSGTGVIDNGTVTNQSNWNSYWATAQAAGVTDVQVKFQNNGGTINYDVVDSNGNSLLAATPGTPSTTGSAGPPAVASTYTGVYAAGGPIVLSANGTDAGATVTVTGTPSSGDSFTITPGGTQSVFRTIANLVATLQSTTLPAVAQTMNLSSALQNISNASNNVLNVQTSMGSRLSELQNLGSLNSSTNIQNQQNLSNLQGLDYASAISSLTSQTTSLQAAMASYSKINQLSLFTYL